ncbi:MAG: GHKL domain-containing protein [Ruminococcus sp.]|nr:GHKL domain-containing protein [Ruminococcus sp.]
MKVLGNKVLRAAAFIMACILLATSVFFMSDTLIKHSEQLSTRDYQLMENDYSNKANTLFVRLWAVANIYMRNLDSDGEFKGNKYFKASTEEAMRSFGLMDKDGNVTIDGDEDFDYIVKYDKNSISNTDLEEKDFSHDYSFIQQNNIVNTPAKLNLHEYFNMSWYTTDYGMSYFNIRTLSPTSVAVFDFDTKGLPFYYDENGAKIYYKEDGSTPVPVKDEETEIEEHYSEYPYRGYPENYGSVEYSNHYVEQNGNKYHYYAGDDTPIVIYLKPKDNIVSKIESAQAEYKALEDQMTKKIVDLIPLVAAAVILGLFFVIMGGYDEEKKKFVLKVPNTIFTEFYVVLAVAALMGAGFFMGSFYEISNTFAGGNKSSLPIYLGIAYAGLYAVGLFAVNAILIQIKCKSLMKSSLIGRFILMIVKVIKGIISDQMLRNDALTRRFLIRTGVSVFLVFAVTFLFQDYGLTFFFGLILLAVYIYFSVNDFRDITKLSEHISAMQSGDYMKVKVPETSVIYGMNKNLNEISDGMQTAVEKRVQSERMKIDLVTNVSHDLKTPLTSIISYIDLLGSEEMSPEAKDYVKILEDKSARLKTIVSDLFDLAKATSGTDVAKDKLDAAILTQQVIGDMGDKIEKYGKDVRTEIKTDSAPVMADGKRMYRVIQNLIDNALKYSLDGTRIYITVSRDKADAVIAVKNISAEEMNFTADEITERFARGDSSRSTEGSGLGLAIAKSFTEANGGQFNVLIDGDMFTAEVRLPINE